MINLQDPQTSQLLLSLGGRLLSQSTNPSPAAGFGQAVLGSLGDYASIRDQAAKSKLQQQAIDRNERLLEQEREERRMREESQARMQDLFRQSLGGRGMMTEPQGLGMPSGAVGMPSIPGQVPGDMYMPAAGYQEVTEPRPQDFQAGLSREVMRQTMETGDPTATLKAYQALIEGQKPEPAFSGQGIDPQSYNVIIDYNRKRREEISTTPEEDMAYSLAYQRAARPQRFTTPDGIMYEQPGMDLSTFVPPTATQPLQPGEVPPSPSGRVQLGEQKFSEGQLKASSFANRMESAERAMAEVTTGGFKPGVPMESALASIPIIGNFTASSEYQEYRREADDWIRAKLRRESGAVIGDEEMKSEYRTYFPIPGDSDEVIERKRKARILATQGMVREAGKAYTPLENYGSMSDQEILRKLGL